MKPLDPVTPRCFDAVIVGPGRVGSTLLARLLRKHPEVFCLNESHDLPVLLARHGTQMQSTRDLIDTLRSVTFVGGPQPMDANANHARRSPADLAAALEHLADTQPQMSAPMLRGWLAGYFAAATGARIIVDKTPDYAHHLPELLAITPELKIILMLRDAVPTALSMRQHSGYRHLAAAGYTSYPKLRIDAPGDPTRPPPEDLAPYLDIWAERLEEPERTMASLPSSQVHRVRYEDLLADPIKTFSELFSFLGVEATDSFCSRLSARLRPATDLTGVAIDPLSPHITKLRQRYGYGRESPL